MPEFLPDFHVVSLQYTLLSSQHVTYVNPVARKFDTEEAHFRLADGKLTCEMKVHCSTAEAARSLVEPVLRAWEVDSDLRWNRGELRFAFDVADIVDRTPPQPGVIQGAICVVLAPAMLSATGTVSVHVSRASYPEPPPHTFRLNPDAQSILDRYCGYLDGREPLLDMAYFCLTQVEFKAGGRKRTRRQLAAARYRIDKDVLAMMGTLTSEHGDRWSARKASAAHPLTGSQGAWVEATVKHLIWRLGDTRIGSALPLITMSDLPPL